MRLLQKFSSKHDDYVHDIKFNWYGQRFATASSDQNITIWGKVGGKWTCTWKWKAHSGSIWKLDWAHPEFGQILATCSEDRSINIWEEPDDVDDQQSSSVAGGGISDRSWDKKATLADSRQSVQDVKFSPRHLGLKLATCSLDGFVRIFEAADTMNLAQWSLTEEFEAGHEPNCLSWNPSRFDPPMLVVGCNDSAGTCKVWAYDDQYRRWNCVDTLSGGGQQGPIHDVAWAPSLGRTYHLIATACKDGGVRIFELRKDKNQKFSNRLLHWSPLHKSEVWRVEWNITGTVLASAGDDGTLRLWKRGLDGKFKNSYVMQGDTAEEMSSQTSDQDGSGTEGIGMAASGLFALG